MSRGAQPDADPDRLVTVGRFLDAVQAELMRSRLEAEGIVCFAQGAGPTSLLPTGTVYPTLLQVRAADAARAREIIDEPPRDADADAAFDGGGSGE